MIQKKNLISIILTSIFALVIVYITCLCRTASFQPQLAPYPMWSYVKAITGDWNTGKQIIENILLFIPLGYLLRLSGLTNKSTVSTGLFLSTAVELAQLIFHIGLFEFDDILNNALGTWIGVILYTRVRNPEKIRLQLSGAVVVCAVIFCTVMPKPPGSIAEQEFYFDIDSCVFQNETLGLKGHCFAYEKPNETYELLLKSGDKTIQMESAIQLPSNDINSYYRCEEDYSNTGFEAKAEINSNEAYEILVQWSNGVTMTTGTFLDNGVSVHTVNPAPDFSGTLLVSRPEYSFYVYQQYGELYWLCGDSFPFEDDGTTYVQYQLWTTQIDRLPQKRLEHECFWDNIGFNFEQNEIEPFGEYRVAKSKIPEEYAVTAIVTGYHKDGKWIWQDYFRPIVKELPNYSGVGMN